MRRGVVWVMGLCLIGLAGCTDDPDPFPTTPPVAPNHQIAGSVLPKAASGYTVLGAAPVAGQLEATYARDADPLDLAVVSFDSSGFFGETRLSEQQWYGASRCGILWEGGEGQTPRPTMTTCVTVLTDGVMTTVASGKQTPYDLAQLASAIYQRLA